MYRVWVTGFGLGLFSRVSQPVPDMDFVYYTFTYLVLIGVMEDIVTKINSKHFIFFLPKQFLFPPQNQIVLYCGLRKAFSEIPKRFPDFFVLMVILGIVALKQIGWEWNKSVMSFN